MAGKTALPPGAHPQGDTPTGVPTTSRQLGGPAGPGPQQVPTNTPSTDTKPGEAIRQRYNDTTTSLDGATASGVTVTRHVADMRRRALLAGSTTIPEGCRPSLDVYTDIKNSGGLKGGEVGAWVCNMDSKIKYRESQYQNFNQEFRLFVEGADVTHYVEGAISWTLESTGGMNSCRFTLNNTQDAFIITPENICAGLDPKGWRLSGLLPPHTYSWRANPARENYRVDETAKFIIYYNKYRAVDPEKAHHEPQIDQQTGMWLYPLNPYSCIFNKHDCVRLFIRLPHVSGVNRIVDNKPTKEWYDLWMPAFTGFIRDYNWDDDPVMGSRYVRVSCYDYRGLMERMRVRVAGIGTQPGSGVQPDGAAGKDGRPQGGAQQPTSNTQQGTNPNGGGLDESFLEAAKQVGAAYESFLRMRGLDKHFPPGTSFQQWGTLNPYTWALNFKLIEAFKDLYKDALSRQLIRQGVAIKLSPGASSLDGIDHNSNAVQQAVAATDKQMSWRAASMVAGIGQVIGLSAMLYQLTGKRNDLQVKGFVTGSGAPIFLASELNGAVTTTPSVFNQKKTSDEHKATQAIINEAATAWTALTSEYNDFILSSSPKSTTFGTVKEIADGYIRDRLKTGAPSAASKLAKTVIVSRFNQLVSAYTSALNKDPAVKNLVLRGFADVNAVPYVPLSDIDKNSATKGSTLEGKPEQALNNYWSFVDGGCKTSANVNKEILNLRSNYGNNISKLQAGYKYFAQDTATLPDATVRDLQIYGVDATTPVPVNAAAQWFTKFKKIIEEDISRSRGALTDKAVKTSLRKMSESIVAMRREGAKDANGHYVKTVGDVLNKFVEFDKATVGVVFGDLVTSTTQGHPHPLAGKNFETAIKFLCTEQSMVQSGRSAEVESYAVGQLSNWNKLVLFGAIQRPITYREMTEVGEGTVRDFDSDYCPLKVFQHMLLPVAGTGAQSIVRQNMGGEKMNAESEPQYKTRLELVNELCESLDYQFFVSPMGDLVFEVPFYNAYPDTFGSVFRGAYTVAQDWIKSSIAEEQSEMPTGWVIQGGEVEKKTDDAAKNMKGSGQFTKLTILNNILARRLGARVEYITIKVPGIGAMVQSGGTVPNVQQQLAAYAAFYIQRQLAKCHVLTVSFPFRPYVAPNRPIWLVPRQRIGLVTSVTHSMTPPSGQCTTDVSIGYVRWLFRDGTFRFIGGGERQPLDYIAFFSGSATYTPTEGTRAVRTLGDIMPPSKAGSPKDSPSDIANRFRAANAFSANVYAAFSEMPAAPDPVIPPQAAATAGNVLTVNPPVTTNAASQNQTNQSATDQATKADQAQNPKNPPPKKDTAPRPPGEDIQFRANGFFVDGLGRKNDALTNSGRQWNALGKFMSPWRFGANNNLFNSWGFLRKNNSVYYAKGEWGTFHPGMDINVRMGLPLVTPIDANKVVAELNIYRNGNPARQAWRPMLAAAGKKYNRNDKYIDGRDPFLKNKKGDLQLNDKGIPYPNWKYRQTAYPAANFFAVEDSLYSNASYDLGGGAGALVYYEYWDAYQEMLGAQKNKLKYLEFDLNGGVRGLCVRIYGSLSPNAQMMEGLPSSGGERKINIMLQYLHCSKFAVTTDGVMGADYTGDGRSIVVRRGDVVGYMGNTGLSKSPHLHVNMYILGPKSGTDPDIFKLTAKANEEFLLAQIIARATNWNPNRMPPLSPDMLNQPVDDHWKGYVQDALKRNLISSTYGNKAAPTVADFVKFYLRNKDYNSSFLAATQVYSKGEYVNRIMTNPMFYFRPEELVDFTGLRRSVNNKDVYRAMEPRNYDAGGSSVPGASPGASIPPSYNGTDLSWCGGLRGTKSSATTTAQVSKAKADANRAVATNPQKKAEEDDKLKKKLEAASAQKAAEDKSKTKARNKPESVRRRFNAMSRKARQKQKSPMTGQATVGPKQTAGK